MKQGRQEPAQARVGGEAHLGPLGHDTVALALHLVCAGVQQDGVLVHQLRPRLALQQLHKAQAAEHAQDRVHGLHCMPLAVLSFLSFSLSAVRTEGICASAELSLTCQKDMMHSS